MLAGRLGAVSLALACALAANPIDARPHATPAPSAAPTKPAPAPTPPSAAERIARLQSALTALSAAPTGAVGFAAIELAHEQRVSARGDEAFPLGGIADVATAIAAYRLADQRRFSLDERVVVRAGDLRAGSPIALAHPTGGVNYAYWELVRAMLVDADATARGIVLAKIGGPRTSQAILERLGVRGLALDAATPTGTPNAVATLMDGLAEGRYLFYTSTTELLDMLGRVTRGATLIDAGLPYGRSSLAHETDAAQASDAGIVTLAGGDRYVIVGLAAPGASGAPIAEAAGALVRAYR